MFVVHTDDASSSFHAFIIIQRSKKCLDFTATVFIVHFFICVFYRGFPIHLEWWFVTIASIFIMALLGEYMCYIRETREIPIRANNNYQTVSQKDTDDGGIEVVIEEETTLPTITSSQDIVLVNNKIKTDKEQN